MLINIVMIWNTEIWVMVIYNNGNNSNEKSF